MTYVLSIFKRGPYSEVLPKVRLGNMPALPKFEFLTGTSSKGESSNAKSTRGKTKDDDSDDEDSSASSKAASSASVTTTSMAKK
uniref:RFC1 n=1 Tax=Meloidogyne hapla TaxID=6305 RepID=A0A1I8BU55_MELHA